MTLRDVEEGDLPRLFEHQQDGVANQMAAFTPRDRDAFTMHWTRLLGDPGTIKKVVLVDGAVAGYVGSFDSDGRREVGYWIDRALWGKGIATRALAEFLEHEPVRPLIAHVAKHNVASVRVLEKCGFQVIGEDVGDAHGRGLPVEEVILALP